MRHEPVRERAATRLCFRARIARAAAPVVLTEALHHQLTVDFADGGEMVVLRQQHRHTWRSTATEEVADRAADREATGPSKATQSIRGERALEGVCWAGRAPVQSAYFGSIAHRCADAIGCGGRRGYCCIRRHVEPKGDSQGTPRATPSKLFEMRSDDLRALWSPGSG